MHHRVDVEEFGAEHPLAQAMAALIWWAWSHGVRSENERMTVVIPRMEMGPSRSETKDVGEWEITVKKVAD